MCSMDVTIVLFLSMNLWKTISNVHKNTLLLTPLNKQARQVTFTIKIGPYLLNKVTHKTTQVHVLCINSTRGDYGDSHLDSKLWAINPSLSMPDPRGQGSWTAPPPPSQKAFAKQIWGTSNQSLASGSIWVSVLFHPPPTPCPQLCSPQSAHWNPYSHRCFLARTISDVATLANKKKKTQPKETAWGWQQNHTVGPIRRRAKKFLSGSKRQTDNLRVSGRGLNPEAHWSQERAHDQPNGMPESAHHYFMWWWDRKRIEQNKSHAGIYKKMTWEQSKMPQEL